MLRGMTDHDATNEPTQPPVKKSILLPLLAVDAVALVGFFLLPDPARWVAGAVALGCITTLALLTKRGEARAKRTDSGAVDLDGPTVS